LPWLALTTVALGACVSATEEESGGDPRFNTAPLESDSGASCGSATADAGNGHAFSDLYRDYFGPTGAASCAGTGQCHGDSSQPGAQASAFVCGPVATSCYQGMIAGSLITAGDTTTAPEDTLLWATIRKCSGGGTMPESPPETYSFDSASLQRIHDWLAAGAPND